MNESPSRYLVISRGQWNRDASPEQIQDAIDRFYEWLEKMVAEGKMESGRRLGVEGRTVGWKSITDGPFGESKEVIGGYWFIFAENLDEAARIASGNPCAEFGLFYEIRPTETVRASAWKVTNETPR